MMWDLFVQDLGLVLVGCAIVIVAAVALRCGLQSWRRSSQTKLRLRLLNEQGRLALKQRQQREAERQKHIVALQTLIRREMERSVAVEPRYCAISVPLGPFGFPPPSPSQSSSMGITLADYKPWLVVPDPAQRRDKNFLDNPATYSRGARLREREERKRKFDEPFLKLAAEVLPPEQLELLTPDQIAWTTFHAISKNEERKVLSVGLLEMICALGVPPGQEPPTRSCTASA